MATVAFGGGSGNDLLTLMGDTALNYRMLDGENRPKVQWGCSAILPLHTFPASGILLSSPKVPYVHGRQP